MAEIDDGIPRAKDGGLLLQGGTYKAISIAYFINQLEHLYKQWRKYGGKYWRNSKFFIIQTPEAKNKLRFLKSSVFHIWLFGVGFPETTIIFTKKKIHLLCKKRDAHLFGVLKAPISRMDPTLFDLEFDIQIKSEEDNGVAQANSIFLNYIQENGNIAIKVGYPIEDDIGVATLLNQLTESRENLEHCDITKGLSRLFIIKNQSEIETIEKSAFLNATVMNRFVERTLSNAIANYDSVTHSELARKITELVLNPTIMINKDFIRHQRINICYPPTVQSGDYFDFSPGVTSNDDNLNAEDGSVIICTIGSSYDDYFSYIARTFLTEPTEYQKTTYGILLKAQEAVILSLRVGHTVNRAYESARQVVLQHDHLLLPHLTQSAGTGIGLEFNESILNIDATNGEIVAPGMVFNVSLGLQNLVDSSGIKFSMLLGDTIVVGDNNSRVLTLSSKGLDNVTHPFTSEESQQYQNGLELLLQGV